METTETGIETEQEAPSDAPYASEESEFYADQAEHARPGPKGGRPRSDGIKPGIIESPIDHPVPTPRIRTYKSDATAANASSKSGWNYWNSLPAWAKDKVVAYVYRDHPILLEPDTDSEGVPERFKYIDKIIGTEPIQDDMDLLHRYGCGSYRVVLTDVTPKKKDERPVCTIWVVNAGGADYKSNPPTDQRVNDVEQIDLNHPANKAYVSFLRGQGKLPEQIDGKVRESEMAAQVTIEKLTDKVISMAETKNKDTGVLQDAMKGAMDVMQKGAEAAIQTTREANEYAARIRDEAEARRGPMLAATPSPVTDPVVTALEIVKLIRENNNGGGNEAEILALRNQLSQMQQSQIDTLREQVRLLMDAKVTTPATATSPFAAMKEGMDAMRQMKQVVDEFAGNTGEEEAAKGVADVVAEAAPKWVTKYLVPLSPILVQIASAWLQSRGQQPQYPPGYIPPPPGFYPPNAPPGIAAPVPQMAQPFVPPRPVPIDNPNNLPPAVVEVLSNIKDSLGFHMHYQMSGTEFAYWYISQFGEPRYREIASLGPDQILQALMLYPPTLNILRVQKEDLVKSFVFEFCNPQSDEEGQGDEEPEQTPTPTVPA